MEYLAGVSFGLRLCTHPAFPYTFFVYYFLFSVQFFLFPLMRLLALALMLPLEIFSALLIARA